MMDPQPTDEDQQCLNLELFVAINYGVKRKDVTEDKIVEKLKDCLCDGADINAANHNDAGNTALHVAVRRHWYKVIRFILEHGAKVKIENSQGLTALTLAQTLKCEPNIVNLLENCAKSTTNKLNITYWSKNQSIWNKFINNSEIAVLEVNSVELSPDFLQQVEFYDAIDSAGNLFFVDVIVSDRDSINDEFINSQLNRLNRQLIIQCGSVTKTKLYCRGSEGDINVIDLCSPVEYFDEKTLTDKLSTKKDFGIGLIVDAIKLDLVGKFETERRSLLYVNFNLENELCSRLIDHAIRYGDVITVRWLSLNPWNLSKLNSSKTSTLTLAAQHGDVEKLAAALRVRFPIQLDNDISIPKETVAHFDKCKEQMLKTAVRTGNSDVSSFLIRCGVQLDADIIELAWDMKRYDVVLMLLRSDCVFPDDFNLDEICENDVIYTKLRTLVEERSYLHSLIEKGYFDSVKDFVKSTTPSKLYLNTDNKSAVYRALISNNFNVFVWLKSELKAEFRDDYERRSLGVGVLDSATDALLPCFIPIENAHILHLVAKSRSHQHYPGFKERIESIYMELNAIPQIATVFKVIQFCDQVDIIYDFDKESIVDVNVSSSECDKGFCEYKAGRIYIGAKVVSERKCELLGTIAHELTHLAIQTVYENNCKPYKLHDPLKDNFGEIIKEIGEKSGPVDSIIRRVFIFYGKDCWPSELIVRVNHMLSKYGSEEGLRRLEVQANSLLKYYNDYVTPCCEKLVRESHLIKPRNIIKVLNDYAGITCKIEESKIRFKMCMSVSEALCESEVQIAVVTSTSPFLSTMSVYQSLNEISQQPNSFLIFKFDGYVKRRIDINQAFYSDVCKFLVLLCESVPEKSSLCESLKKLAQVLWKKSDKKVIFIMENCELSNDDVKELVNLSLNVCPDVEYTLDNLTIESAKLLLDQSVSLQCRDANIKLSGLIDEEHYKLVDAQTLLKLINKHPIVIGKEIITSCNFDEHFYIDRSFCHQVVIKEAILRDEHNKINMYAISELDEAALSNIVRCKNSVCAYKCLSEDRVVKYVILDRSDEAEQYEQLCQQFPLHTIHWLKKVDGGFHWLKSRCVKGEVSQRQAFIDAQPFSRYRENDLVEKIAEQHVIIVSDSAGMGKSTTLTSLTHRFKTRYPHLWMIRVNLNDYTRCLEKHCNLSFEVDQPSRALEFLVDNLLGSRVESRLETEFEKNLLLHLINHNEDRVVIMFDGFDEIKWRHQNMIRDVLVALKRSKVKQLWVAARPHVRETLEKTLHQLAHTLQPLDEKDQVNFLTRFWRRKLNLAVASQVASGCNLTSAPDKLQCFAEALMKLLSKFIIDKEKEFTGVPLQLKMVAEAFEQDAIEFYFSTQTQPNLPSKLQLNDLFGMFFNRKYTIFQSVKNRSDSSKPNVEAQNDVLREYFLNNHRISSLFSLFNDKGRELLLTKEEFNSGISFINEIASNKLNTGLIDSVVDGKPRFVHLTFAKFLTAEFIVKLLTKGHLTIDLTEFLVNTILYNDYFKVVRAFIDSHLDEKSITDAVLIEHGNIMRLVWSEKTIIYRLGSFIGNIMRFMWTQKAIFSHLGHFIGNIMRSVWSEKTKSHSGHLILQMFRSETQNGPFPNGCKTLLHVAAEEGNANIANFLLNCLGDCNIRAKLMQCVTMHGYQALHLAAAHGHLDVVKALIHHKADVNAPVVDNSQNTGGYNALLLAAYCGYADICECLINNGADINATVGNGPFKGHNVLHLAVARDNFDVVKMLGQRKDIDVGAVVRDTCPFVGMTALHIAASKRHWHLVKWIISQGLIDVNATINDCINCRRTVLTEAVMDGPVEIVQWLIDHNADVNNDCDCDKNTALHLAALENKLDVVDILVNSGANVNAVDCYGRTPLHWAASGGSVLVVGFLLKNKDVDVNANAVNDGTPLHVAAFENELKVVETLVSHGADVNAVDSDGHTPLHVATQLGFDHVVEYLLTVKDVDVNAVDADGRTPLVLASDYGNQTTVEILTKEMEKSEIGDKMLNEWLNIKLDRPVSTGTDSAK